MKRLGPRHMALALIAVGAIYWMLPSTHHRRETSICQANLTLIGLAMLQYARDYNETFPLATSWQDGIAPCTKQVFRCPTTDNSYAFNRFVLGVNITQIAAMPGTTIISDRTVTPLDTHNS